MLSQLMLLFHTVRYLRPVQIYSRIKLKLYRPLINNNNLPSVCDEYDEWKSPIQREASLISLWKFRFLNEEHALSSSSDWDNNKFSKLWRYNLHYFDDLNAKDAGYRVEWHRIFLNKWIAENPPSLGSGWEPYPTSLRIVNWIKWSLAGHKLDADCLHSLAIQARWLSKKLEFHILGNHLFANAKALIFSGLFFKGPEADKWLATGVRILTRELPEQILTDGGHFELSPMYHNTITEDLLDLLNVTKALPGQVSKEHLFKWRSTCKKMLQWSNHMKHPDGEIAFFNDSAFGIAATFEQLKEYAERLGITDFIKSEPLIYLEGSGYIKLENNIAFAILDVAKVGPDYLPGHAHADTLSFELSLFGQRVFVNSGVSEYGVAAIRKKQRGTELHNTVYIDNRDSSQVWAGFRVANRAYPSEPKINETMDGLSISCSHDGYNKAFRKCIHKRSWLFESNAMLITDTIEGSFNKAVANYYLHPNVSVECISNNIFRLLIPTGEKVDMIINSVDQTELLSSLWYPEFGKSYANQCISVEFYSKEYSARLSW